MYVFICDTHVCLRVFLRCSEEHNSLEIDSSSASHHLSWHHRQLGYKRLGKKPHWLEKDMFKLPCVTPVALSFILSDHNPIADTLGATLYMISIMRNRDKRGQGHLGTHWPFQKCPPSSVLSSLGSLQRDSSLRTSHLGSWGRSSSFPQSLSI